MKYEHLTRRGQIQRMREIARHALPLYGIEPVSIALLLHAYHTTFTVTGADGVRYVLHILRHVQGPPFETSSSISLESELWWLDRIRTHLGLTVPAPVRTPEGNGVVSVSLEGIEPPRLCSLYHWVDARLVMNRLTTEHLEAVGRLTAQLHNHAAELSVPPWFNRPRVDNADAETEAGVIRLVTEGLSPHAAVVTRRALRRVRHAQETLGSGPGVFGLIHADIHQRNYLFKSRDVRLIDFGDCGWGHYLYDLAVTVSELGALPRYADLRAALLDGYRQERDLSLAHEALIDTFVMLRDVQNLTVFMQIRDDPTFRGRFAHLDRRVIALERRLDEAT